jgi:hypothetical protein
MAEFNQDYLKWDSNSLKRVITRKLSENPLFTDQVFQDSNLSTLIDVFSFMYDVLSYYTNHGASEAMFNDSEIYENINRIVKMLGYNPLGHNSPQIDCTFFSQGDSDDVVNFSQIVLPKYTTVDTNIIDPDGNSVLYSMVTQRFLSPDASGVIESVSTDTTLFTNGQWKLYDTTFTATGTPFESFIMDLITLEDENESRYIAHPNVDVYIKRANATDASFDYIKYEPISQGTLFGDQSNIFGPQDDVFELRINENKQYVVTFGDGVHGSRLRDGDELFIVYLEGNGNSGKIGAGFLNSNNQLSIQIAGMTDALLADILDISVQDLVDLRNNITPQAPATGASVYVSNINASTSFASLESVDEIRVNAPTWFRMGDRLITAQDYEQYVETIFKSDVVDTHVMNNWEYLASFLEWLDRYNALTIDIREREYPYADSCDFNNVYIWTKFKGASVSSNIIENNLQPRKCLTAEPLVLTALDSSFVPTLKNNNYDVNDWDPFVENYLEVKKDKNSFITIEKVRDKVTTVVNEFFKADFNKIGQNVDIRDLHNQILAVDGVDTVRTAYRPVKRDGSGDVITDSEGNPIYVQCEDTLYFDGLSFAMWTPTLVRGRDLQIINGNIKLRNFQFPKLLDSQFLKLDERIKVVFEAFGSPSVEY